MYQRVPAEDQLSSPAETELVVRSVVKITVFQSGKEKLEPEVDLSWAVREVKERLFSEDLHAGKNIRIIFQGKMLTDDMILSDSGVKEKSFLHVSITEPVSAVPSAPVSVEGQERDLEAAELERLALAYENYQPPPVVEGSSAEFVLGFAMGFVLGFLALLWVYQPLTSRKQKLGIILGVFSSSIYAILSKPVPSQNPSSASP
jgi:hypothetical protein